MFFAVHPRKRVAEGLEAPASQRMVVGDIRQPSIATDVIRQPSIDTDAFRQPSINTDARSIAHSSPLSFLSSSPSPRVAGTSSEQCAVSASLLSAAVVTISAPVLPSVVALGTSEHSVPAPIPAPASASADTFLPTVPTAAITSASIDNIDEAVRSRFQQAIPKCHRLAEVRRKKATMGNGLSEMRAAYQALGMQLQDQERQYLDLEREEQALERDTEEDLQAARADSLRLAEERVESHMQQLRKLNFIINSLTHIIEQMLLFLFRLNDTSLTFFNLDFF